MRILIIGAGETGYYIASEFSVDNFHVTVIDENPVQLKNIERALNIAGVRGSGTSIEVLENAGIDTTDILIACTNQDETNLICCLLAKQYNVKHTVAVTRTDSYLKREVIARYVKSGISQVINSSLVTAQEIVSMVNLPSAAEVSAFGEKNILLVGYRVRKNSPWKDLQLKDIRQSEGENQFLIASIVRNGRSFIPTGQDTIRQADYVYVLIPRQIAHILNDILNIRIASNRKAVVAGDNQIAERVVQGLLKSHYTVTMICHDELTADKMRKKFSHRRRFNVVHGDCEQVKLQHQLDVAVSALFIAVNNDDHLNIAAGMVAHYLGASRTICLVNRQDLIHAAESVEIDVIISPRLNTARQIKKMVRGREHALSYTTISETNMEVMEIVASETAEILSTPLKDIKLPPNTLVGALIRENHEAIIPTGMTTIEANDKVVMVSTPERVDELHELFEGEALPHRTEI